MVPFLWLDAINKNTLCVIRQETWRKEKHPTWGADLKEWRVGVKLGMIRGQRGHCTWVELRANLMACSRQLRCSDLPTHLITPPCICGQDSSCDPWAAHLQRVYVAQTKSIWCHALIKYFFFFFFAICVYLFDVVLIYCLQNISKIQGALLKWISLPVEFNAE